MKSQSIKEEPMDSFQKWLHKIAEGDESSVHDNVWDGDYNCKARNIMGLLEEAFDAGIAEGIDAAYEFL